jgi:uncharacterized protein with GYD domain
MSTFLMFGKYSIDALAKISAARTKDATAIIGDCGGILKAAYTLLGETDLIIVTEFPSIENAMKASVAMSKKYKIGFKTAAALNVDEFDKLMAKK